MKLHSKSNAKLNAYQRGWNDYESGYEPMGHQLPAYLEADYQDGYGDARDAARLQGDVAWREALREIEMEAEYR